MKSGVTSGTHHIFFPPRLYVAVAEPMPDGDGRDASDLIFLDQPLLQKLQGPVIPPLGRVGAGQGHEIGLGLRGELPWLAGAGGVVEGALQASFCEASPDTFYGTDAHVRLRRDLLVGGAFSALQEHASPHDDAGTVVALPYKGPYLFLFLLREGNDVLLFVFVHTASIAHIPKELF